MTKRFALAAVGIVAISGSATVVFARAEIDKLIEALHQSKVVKLAPHVLAPTSRGAPETLLLVGNDERKLTKYYHQAVLPHSNEMLLVRIDPSKPTISMLSIPRELDVPIHKPNGEVEDNRINAAYTYGWENGGGTAGGVKLMVQTIKQVLGISINHVFVTTFTKFEHAVNAMGCVYMTVDKRYYHNNETEVEQYMEINLRPGYQRLCGRQAREFVSNRHESTSLIRDARDQRFLLAAKAQYGSSLVEDHEKFEHIFGKYVESTLQGEEEILQLVDLLAESAGKPVRQVDFHVNLGPTLDTATPQQIHEAVHSFLTGTSAIPRQSPRSSAPSRSHSARAHRAPAVSRSLDLSPTPSATIAQARSMAPDLPFPVQAPLYQRTTAESAPDEMHSYQIEAPHRHRYPAYAIVVQQGELGQYYDIQGTAWTKAPLLAAPNRTVKVGSRTYSLFYDGEHLKTVAWLEASAAYWVENTLTNNLSPEQMVAIASETLPVIGHLAGAGGGSPPKPPAIGHLDLRARAIAALGAVSKAGDLLGYLGLAIVAALSILLLVRQQELRRLREQVAYALALQAREQQMLLATRYVPSTQDAPGEPQQALSPPDVKE